MSFNYLLQNTNRQLVLHKLLVAIMLICTFVTSIQAQIATTTLNYDDRVSTIYDGVTWDKYVSYLKLDGKQILELPMDNLKNGVLQEYTVMLWFKPSGESWGTRYQYAFEFLSSLQCFFTSSNLLMCDSIQRSDKLQADITSIHNNQWTHLTVIGHPTLGVSYLTLESNSQVLQEDQKSYVVLQQSDIDSWTLCLGGCSPQFGFAGGFRDFIFMNKYVTKDTARRLKNHYMLWDSNIVAYYRFNEGSDFLKDEFKNRYAKMSSGSVLQSRDFIPNDICYPITDTQLFQKFNLGSQTFSSIEMASNWSPLEVGWQYSFSVWVKIGTNSCSQSSPYTAQKQCYLAQFSDSFMLFQPQKNQVAVYFFCAKPYYEYQSQSVAVPQNQWVNIQFTASQLTGYEIRVYDILGRMMSFASEQRNLQAQSVSKTKKLAFFKNFEGLAKSLIMFKSKSSLPIKMPEASLSSGLSSPSKECIVYFKFNQESIQACPVVKTGKLVNYCENSTYGVDHVALSSYPSFEGSYNADYSFGSGVTHGLLTSSQNLFDGIACNDGQKVQLLTSSDSYIKSTTSPFTKALTSATVEFWFKTNDPNINKTNQLLSLWAKTLNQEYFTIVFDQKTKLLICAPFGIDIMQSPYITYPEYSQLNKQKYGWLHLVCQFNSSLISGSIHKGDLNSNTNQNLTGNNFSLPADTYEIYIGNTKNLLRGTPALMMKEFRFWGFQRDMADIKLWRYRQIDPRSFNVNQLLTYIRFDEGNYEDYNFASTINSNLVNSLGSSSFQNVIYTQDTNLVVCPLGTYYSSDYSKCYQDPVTQLVALIYPLKENGTYYWVFDESSSIIINNAFLDSIKVQWQFEDPILKKIVEPQMNQAVMKIPAHSFREETFYKVRLNLSNTDITFNRIQDLTFVPVSCQYFLVNSDSATSVYNNYTDPQSFFDVSFSFDLQYSNTYCRSMLFFNSLVPNVTYTFVPPLPANKQINLEITFSNSTKTGLPQITVVIPAQEQYKFPIQTDQKIVFKVFWTNAEYEAMIDPSTYVFQNLMYTINFNTIGATVVPQLNVNSSPVLRGDSVTLDASGTYITNQNFANGLTFQWQCPSGFEKLCAQQTGSMLMITSSGFQSINATYNKTYTFTVKIAWEHSANGKTVTTNYQASTEAIWYNILTPTFTLYQPIPVLATADFQQKFQIVLNNYDIVNLTVLSIQWSIVPNLTVKALNLTQNNTVLTVNSGVFAPMTTYSLSVTVSNRLNSIAVRSKSLSFATQAAPFGGNVTITPMDGFVKETNFTIILNGWQSYSNGVGDMKYKVWSTTNSSGSIKSKLLTNGFQNASENFTFEASNTFPYLVEITDDTSEKVILKVSPNVKYATNFTTNSTSNSTSNSSTNSNSTGNSTKTNSTNNSSTNSNSTSNTTKINSTSSNSSTTNSSSIISNSSNSTNSSSNLNQTFPLSLASNINKFASIQDKYTYMGDFVEYINSDQFQMTLTSNNDQAYIIDLTERQVQARMAIVDQIAKDIQLIDIPKYIQNEESFTIMRNSISMISSMTTEPRYMDDYIVTSIVEILNNLQKGSIFEKLMREDTQFKEDFINSISNMLQYSQYRIQQSTRLLFQTTTKLGISQINRELQALINILIQSLCTEMSNKQYQQELNKASFDIVIQKYSVSEASQIELRSFLYETDQKSRVNLKVNEMMSKLIKLDDNLKEVCVATSFYKVSMNPDSYSNKQSSLTQYSTQLTEFQIVGYDLMYNSRDVVEIYFAIDPATFRTNQTVCMAFIEADQVWSENVCNTEIDEETYQVKCQCNMIDTLYYALITNPTKEEGSKIKQPTHTNRTDHTNIYQSATPQTSSSSFIGILVLLIVFAVFIPAIAFILDKKDYRASTQQALTKSELNLLRKTAKVSGMPLSYWVFRNEDVQNYQIQSKSLFAHILVQTHPLISIMAHFDIQASRISRFTLYFLQVSLFSLVSVLVFGPSYRQEAKLMIDNTIDTEDINQILTIGIIGMFMLMPLPWASKCCIHHSNKSPTNQTMNQTKIQNESQKPQINQQQDCKTNKSFLPENQSAEQNQYAKYGSPTLDVYKTQSIEGSNSNLAAMSSVVSENTQAIIFSAQMTNQSKSCAFMPYILLLLAYGTCLTAIVLTIIYSAKVSASNQYCMLVAFYLGFFGNIMLTSLLLSSINTFLSDVMVSHKNAGCLRFIVSVQALKVAQERAFVREASQMIKAKEKAKSNAIEEKSDNKVKRVLTFAKNNNVDNVVNNQLITNESKEQYQIENMQKQIDDTILVIQSPSPQELVAEQQQDMTHHFDANDDIIDAKIKINSLLKSHNGVFENSNNNKSMKLMSAVNGGNSAEKGRYSSLHKATANQKKAPKGIIAFQEQELSRDE